MSGLGELLDLFLPRHCVGCGHPGALLCMGCLPVGRAVSGWSGDLETLAAGRYEGPVRAALLHYKERAGAISPSPWVSC